jgi:nitrogen regulatory protein PII-like uncharacterized protein
MKIKRKIRVRRAGKYYLSDSWGLSAYQRTIIYRECKNVLKLYEVEYQYGMFERKFSVFSCRENAREILEVIKDASIEDVAMGELNSDTLFSSLENESRLFDKSTLERIC